MKLDEIIDTITKDMIIDKTQLDVESLAIPSKFNKYYKILMVEKVTFRKLESEYNVLYRRLWEYYSGKADAQTYRDRPFSIKLLKVDLPMYINSDAGIIAKSQILELQREKIKYLEQVLSVINNRSFQISNAINFLKFTNGGV